MTKSSGFFSIMAAIPTTDEIATKATPISSPHIKCNDRFTPMVIPIVMDKVMHIPGVIETKKKVGMKTESSAKFM
jgi:hypothetical protein